MTNTATRDKSTTSDEDTTEGRVSVGFSVPIPMKIRLETLAVEAGVPTNEFIRDMVAKVIGFDLPKSTTVRRGKYASEEAKKAAQKAAAKEHRENMKALLQRHRAAAGLPTAE